MRAWNLAVALGLLAEALFLSPVFGEQTGPFHVRALDPAFDAQALSGPDVVVDSETGANENEKRELPSLKTRQALIEKAGLQTWTESWDAADRDLLYLRAKNLKTAAFRKRYSKLPRDLLAKFKTLVLSSANP